MDTLRIKTDPNVCVQLQSTMNSHLLRQIQKRGQDPFALPAGCAGFWSDDLKAPAVRRWQDISPFGSEDTINADGTLWIFTGLEK
jgi:hypothetical protein